MSWGEIYVVGAILSFVVIPFTATSRESKGSTVASRLAVAAVLGLLWPPVALILLAVFAKAVYQSATAVDEGK